MHLNRHLTLHDVFIDCDNFAYNRSVHLSSYSTPRSSKSLSNIILKGFLDYSSLLYIILLTFYSLGILQDQFVRLCTFFTALGRRRFHLFAHLINHN